MKNSIKKIKTFIVTTTTLVCLTSLILFESCSKDETTTSPKNNDLVYENNNQVNIPEKVNGQAPTPANSEINVTATGTLKDISKFTLEMNIEHNYQRDLQFDLVAPDGTSRTFIYRRGLAGKYLLDQKLRFNSTFTAQLSDEGNNFLAGNYKECKGSVSLNPPPVDPIFQFLQNKNVNGIWKLRATDWEVVNTGSIKSWRLVFSQGAILP